MTLTVTDASLATAQKVRVGYVVLDTPALASFTKNKTGGNTPLVVNFDGSGSTGSNLVYAWNFGDPGSGSANSSSLQTPTHTFSTVNTFNVTLTVSNAAGPNTSAPQSITTTAPSGGTFPFNPVADSQVQSGGVNSNYGTLTPFRTREGTGASGDPIYLLFFRFNVTGLTGSVSAVHLRLYTTTATSMTQTVYPVADTGWGETTITYANAPTIGTTALGSAVASAANAYVDITLSPTAVTGNGLVSFALKSSGTSSTYFMSREGTNQPQLVITTGP